MDGRLHDILRAVGDDEVAIVARAALGATEAMPLDRPAFAELTTAHNDTRTIGIVRATGLAAGYDGAAKPWSAVVKVIDLAVPPRPESLWVRPEHEEIFYEHRCFSGNGLDFRPAHCYRVSRLASGVKALWLEDLTAAAAAPFAANDLAIIARSLGQWNGRQAVEPATLPFAVARDSAWIRFRNRNVARDLEHFRTVSHDSWVRAMYGYRPPEMAIELARLLRLIGERALDEPHGLAFGDINVGNVFLKDNSAVAVDWASLTDDPIGADGGCLIGSATTWGPRFMDILRVERDIYAVYVEGLEAAGWQGDSDILRRGYFTQFGGYLLAMAIQPSFLRHLDRATVERRFGVPWDEIASLGQGFGDILPSYVAELERLVG